MNNVAIKAIQDKVNYLVDNMNRYRCALLLTSKMEEDYNEKILELLNAIKLLKS